MYHDLIRGIQDRPGWVVTIVAFLAFYIVVDSILIFLQGRKTSLLREVLGEMRGLLDESREQYEQLLRETDIEIDRVNFNAEVRTVGARRELSGYREAVQHLTAHPTTVVVSPDHDTWHTAAKVASYSAREAARNGEPLPE